MAEMSIVKITGNTEWEVRMVFVTGVGILTAAGIFTP